MEFFRSAARLAVEVDSDLHALGDQPRRDERRDCWVAGQGMMTPRRQARDVMGNLEGGVHAIVAAAAER